MGRGSAINVAIGTRCREGRRDVSRAIQRVRARFIVTQPRSFGYHYIWVNFNRVVLLFLSRAKLEFVSTRISNMLAL